MTDTPEYISCSKVLVKAEKALLEKQNGERWKDWGGNKPSLVPPADTEGASNQSEKLPDNQPLWTGIALSGGGIRSAVFCLGALQALAAKDLLKRFDYISSVSGGGCTSAALQWWCSERRFAEEKALPSEKEPYIAVAGLRAEDFPFGSAHPDPNVSEGDGPSAGKPPLTFLRRHARYLTPGRGIDLWAGIAVVMRTILLNVLIWIPLAAAVFWLVLRGSDGAIEYLTGWPPPLPDWVIPPRWATACSHLSARQCELRLPALFGASIFASYCLFALFIGWTFVLAFIASVRSNTRRAAALGICVSILGLAGIALAVCILVRAILSVWTDYAGVAVLVILSTALVLLGWAKLRKPEIIDRTYRVVRQFDQYAGTYLKINLSLFFIGIVPVVTFHAAGPSISAPTIAGLLAFLSGIASAIQGYSMLVAGRMRGMVNEIVATVCSIVFLVSALCCAYFLAAASYTPNAIVFNKADDSDPYAGVAIAIFWVIVPIAVGLVWIVRVNVIGLHRFYRDRLMEAFMPSSANVMGRGSGLSPVADRLSISELVGSQAPYPLINTNVILVNDDDPDFSERGGDSFILTPEYVGSRATGWTKTSTFEKLNGPITLASAVAASAAAANANAGYVGAGITRGRVVSLLMTLLNVRLGLWIANPAKKADKLAWRNPNNLYAGLICGIFGRGYRRNSQLVELSDGGHFDNLGIYELIRRRCGLIIVIDGEEDAKATFPALTSVLSRLEKDFEGVRIEFDKNEGLDRLVPNTAGKFPAGALCARSSFFVAQIHYPTCKEAPTLSCGKSPDALRDKSSDASNESAAFTGVLIYCKASVIADLSVSVGGYLAKYPEFPHQSTIDQFFDPDQFEAYRELGYESMRRMIGALKLDTTLSRPDEILKTYNPVGV
ncbi:patatin-like phospholipase family protein [Bradyrhizobium sp. USDA 10063]